jgi:hypothetical protein
MIIFSVKEKCTDSWLQLLAIASTSLVFCVIAILTFYRAFKPSIAEHKPLLQLLCIKIIVILDAVQAVSSSIKMHR